MRLELHRRPDHRPDMEKGAADDLELVHLVVDLELERRPAEPFLHAQCGQWLDLDDRRLARRELVEHLDVLEPVGDAEPMAAEYREPAVDLQAVERQEVVEPEPVPDLRLDHFEVSHRLLEPAEDAPERLFDRVLRLFLGQPRCVPLLPDRCRTLAQLIEQRRTRLFGHPAKIP
jgi:hypothetical protein